MKRILFILLFTTPFIGFGQSWEKTFGGTNHDYGGDIKKTIDGGYLVLGRGYSFGINQLSTILIKITESGDSLWSKNLSEEIIDVNGLYLEQTTDSGYVIGGVTHSLDMDISVVKIDINGDTLWAKTYGNNLLNGLSSIQQTTDEQYILCGYTGILSTADSRDVFLMKIDVNGDSLWSKNFGGTNYDVGNFVQQTNDGGYIICGVTKSFGNINGDIYLIKTDSNGDSLWTKNFGLSDINFGMSVQQTTDDGFIITGEGMTVNGDLNIFLIKTDSQGNTLWTKTFGGTDHHDYGRVVQQTMDGGYIILGMLNYLYNGDKNVFLIKTNTLGDTLWTKTFGGTGNELCGSVEQTTDGGYIIVGSTASFGNGGHDIYLIKTNENGNITSTFNIPVSSNRKLEKVVDILGRETKPNTNTPFIEIYDDGSTEKKIVID